MLASRGCGQFQYSSSLRLVVVFRQFGCCYIAVDSAMAASQNGFCSYKLSIHKKTNIMQIMTKNITILFYLIFYHREIVKLDHFMKLSLSYANMVL